MYIPDGWRKERERRFAEVTRVQTDVIVETYETRPEGGRHDVGMQPLDRLGVVQKPKPVAAGVRGGRGKACVT